MKALLLSLLGVIGLLTWLIRDRGTLSNRWIQQQRREGRL